MIKENANQGKKNKFLIYILQDILGDIPGINYRVMFGGYGLYQDALYLRSLLLTNYTLKWETAIVLII